MQLACSAADESKARMRMLQDCGHRNKNEEEAKSYKSRRNRFDLLADRLKNISRGTDESFNSFRG